MHEQERPRYHLLAGNLQKWIPVFRSPADEVRDLWQLRPLNSEDQF
jgi:hypothetical protein